MLRIVFAVLVACLVALPLVALKAQAQDKPVIQKVQPSRTSPASGAEMFRAYCAVCHGKDGKGGGPAAPALKKEPADLTRLSRANGGKFPELRVYSTIQGDYEVVAHGSREMPVWGAVFASMARGNEAEVKMRVSNLTNYVKTLQQR